MTLTPWEVWASGVLDGISALVDPDTVDALWAWSNAETAPYDLMRWNNPLNTTEKFGNSFDSGAQPGTHDVQVYTSVQDGIDATVLTLANGFYPNILMNLRGSVPRQQWQNACGDLVRWGTGCGWIQSTYGPAPGNLGGEVVHSEKRAWCRLAYVSGLGREPESDAALEGHANSILDDGSNIDAVIAGIIDSAEGIKHLADLARAIADVEPPTPGVIPPGTAISFTGTVTGSGTTK
jgi:hypothetical protein